MQLLRGRNLEWAHKSMKASPRSSPVVCLCSRWLWVGSTKAGGFWAAHGVFSSAVGATCWMGLRSLTPELENSLYHTQNILLCFIGIAGLEQPFSFITVFSPNQPTWQRFISTKNELHFRRHATRRWQCRTCRSSASWDSPGFICLIFAFKNYISVLYILVFQHL